MTHWAENLRTAPMRIPQRAPRWIAILTAIAFLLLLASAATHHHESAVEDNECAVCATIAHKFVDGKPEIAAPAFAGFFLYLVARWEFASASFHRPRLSPPSCGPPRLA